MKVAITVHFQYSFFSSGSPQTALAVGEVLRVKGHQVSFLNIGTDNLWWEDLSGLRAEWPVTKSAEGFDLVIEVGGHLLSAEERKKAKKTVWLYRKNPLFNDIEACLYPFTNGKRDLEGIQEVWMFEDLVTKDDVQYIQLLTRKPVRLLPYVWTPAAIEIHRRENKAPVWQQIAALPELKDASWKIHITETNTSSASSCTIPLFIVREIKKKLSLKLDSKITIHNAENVRQSAFFQDNVYSHAMDGLDLSGEFVGRQRVIDFVYHPYSIVIQHGRFCRLRPYLIDLAWVGIPFVHTMRELGKRLGGVVQEGYYEDNDILGGKSAFERVAGKAKESTVESLMEIRKKILEEFTPFSERIQRVFDIERELITHVPTPAPIAIASPVKPLRLGFCSMWDDFNPEYNPFTLMLEAAYKGRKVQGIDITNEPVGNESCDVLIFGPFGERWRDVKASIPKVHFTGENTPRVKEANLNLGFEHVNGSGDEYLRLPLWMLEINWFGADVERLENPKPIPIDRCCKVYQEELEQKKKFCAFVVSNPCQPMRNAAFQWLNSHRPVDSAGRLFNNIGDGIFAGRGGGGGELMKLEFFKSYKYALTFENNSAPGYVTEKILHAKAAGCIPIYWGDPILERDFDVGGCIDARKIQTRQELIDLVEEVERDEELYKKKFNTPALDEVARDKVRRTLAECARRIWALAGLEEAELNKMPRFIGYTTDVEVPSPAPASAPSPALTSPFTLNNTVFVTAANAKFLPSLQLWLQAVKPMKDANPQSKVIVYLMNDVKEDIEKEYTSTYPFLEVRRFPTATPEGFPDLWAPEHYAWKLYIYHTLVREDELKGKLCFYSDAGAMMSRVPYEWLAKAKDTGICVLEDKTQTNDRWCHDTFKNAMKMTQEELAANQIVAGIMAFISGNSQASQIFEEAWSLAQRKEIICGKKWEGINAAGKPFGHRHDQSILSLLTVRANIATYPLEKVYCDLSLRQTFLKGASLYVHRGNFAVHRKLTDEIDDVWVINLDRRKDRMEKFEKGHVNIAGRALRLPAFDGRELKLTPKIARLFAPHDFNWKKAVMGCALSHLAVWMKLINDAPDINSYLILEDDVRLHPNWRERWDDMIEEKALPQDWDVVYLGGVLPPNRDGFEAMCVEKVNSHVGRVRENTMFGQREANRYFHFCAYAYVLSRRGAKKIIEVLKQKGGYWTSADHMICNLVGYLNMYFLHPLAAGCYQDDDPKYCNSAFNDFSRKDEFDSDLWNNNDHFSEEEVKAVMPGAGEPLDILGALVDARRVIEEKAVSPLPPLPPLSAAPLPPLPLPTPKRKLVQIAGPPIQMSKLYEFSWLKTLLQGLNTLEIEYLDTIPEASEEPIVVLQRPFVEESREILSQWKSAGRTFFLLHLSDEYAQDPVDFYNWPECLGVIRNYVREDVPNSEKVKTVPLGYHWANEGDEPLIHTPRVPFRDLVWSFVGTGWCGRAAKLEVLKQIPGEHKCILQEEWNAPGALGKKETIDILLNSWFVPCPGGQNPETFRVYEALEGGAVPVLVKEAGMEPYLKQLAQWMPLMVAETWMHAAGLIHTLHEKPEVYEQYRLQVLAGWEKCKREVREWVRTVFKI